MKNLFLVIFFLVYLTDVTAKYFPGFFVSLDNDTIQCRFDVKVNMFDSKKLNPLSFNRDFAVGFVAKAEMPIKTGALEVFFPQS